MNEKLLKPLLFAAAVGLCLFGVMQVLRRPLPQGNMPESASSADESGASQRWEQLLPAEPVRNLSPSPFPGEEEGLSEAGLVRTISLSGGGELRLALSGSALATGKREMPYKYRLESIRITEGERTVQTISFSQPYYQSEKGALWTDLPDFGFFSGDFNFDGSMDFSVATNLRRQGSSGDYFFHFLWSPEWGCFVPAPDLDALPSPEFDPGDQTVSAAYTSGSRRITERYRYTGGGLQGLEKREIFLNPAGTSEEELLYQWGPDGWQRVSDSFNLTAQEELHS